MDKKGDNGKNVENFVYWFSELKGKDVSIAGVKGANLGEIYLNKFPVPPGFVITSDAYRYFIEFNKLGEVIESILKTVNVHDANVLDKSSKKIRHVIEESEMPKDMKEIILESYGVLDVDKSAIRGASESALDILRAGHEPTFVAVRSSGIISGFEDEIFPRKHDNLLNIKGNDEVISAVKKVYSSLFSPKALLYRYEKGIFNEIVSSAVIVQKMVDANKSGVVYSKDPAKSERLLIEAIYGLGEGRYSENIEPDSYFVGKDLELIDKNISDKKVAVARNSSGNRSVIHLDSGIRRKDVLTGHEIKMISQYAKRLEEHFGEPQDVEFAIDNEKIYVVQTKPIEFGYEVDEEEIVVMSQDGVKKDERSEKKNMELEKKVADRGIEVKTGDISSIEEEDRVLNALEEEKDLGDEYSPSIDKVEDVPTLNEAIPVSSDEFEENQEEVIEVEPIQEETINQPLEPIEPEVIQREPKPEGEEATNEISTSADRQADKLGYNVGEVDETSANEVAADSEIDEMLPDEEVESESEERSVAFEEQLDAIFDREVEIEVEESEARSEAIAKVTGQKPPQVGDDPGGGEGDKKEQMLDIF